MSTFCFTPRLSTDFILALGNGIIDMFIINPITPIPIWLRRLVKDKPEFLPRAATTNRALACLMLKSSYGNTICLYHDKNNKGGTKHDDIRNCTEKDDHPRSDTVYNVTGVTYCRAPMAGVPPATREMWLRDHPGHIHCGCALDVALVELYIWKTWRATNAGGDSELFGKQKMDPRTRQFVVQNFLANTGLDVHTMYDKRLSGKAATRARLLKQIEQLAANFEYLANEDGLEGRIEFTVCQFILF